MHVHLIINCVLHVHIAKCNIVIDTYLSYQKISYVQNDKPCN